MSLVQSDVASFKHYKQKYNLHWCLSGSSFSVLPALVEILLFIAVFGLKKKPL